MTPQQQLEELEKRRAALREEIARADASLEQLKQEGAAARAAAAEAKTIVVPPELAGSSNAQLEQRLMMNAIRTMGAEEMKRDAQRELEELEADIGTLRDEVNRCNQTCTAGDLPADDIGVTGGQPGTAVESPAPPAKCEPCETPAEELKRLDEERRQLDGMVDRLDAEIRELEQANAHEQRNIEGVRRAAKDPKYADHQKIADDMIKRSQERINGTNSSIDARRSTRERARQHRQELDERRQQLYDQLDKCNSSCPITRRTLWYGIGGGAVALGALTLGGGEASTTVSTPPAPAAPIASPPPSQPPSQPQPPQPPAEPPPTVAGLYDCLECASIDDAGGHNGVIRLCDFAGGVWEVLVASITIRHAAPFVNIEGAAFDQSSGNFRGATRGTVAGFANVGIAIEGNANAQTGRITFSYTMGTGGELPGGRPITYRITLQKRR